MVSGLPWVMKEWDWFFGTTALTSGTLSLMPCNMTGGENWNPREYFHEHCKVIINKIINTERDQTSTKKDLRSLRCSNMLKGHESSWVFLFSTSSWDRRTGWGSCAVTHIQNKTDSYRTSSVMIGFMHVSGPWVTGRVSVQSCWSCLPLLYAPFHQWWRPGPLPLQHQTNKNDVIVAKSLHLK